MTVGRLFRDGVRSATVITRNAKLIAKERGCQPGLIEVPDAQDGSPRLVETENLDAASTEYTTLSHRWGEDPEKHPLRTLKENLLVHCQYVPKPHIPKTFLDAMSITRKLGVRYIWIDSLCIIQDSDSDWQQQAGKMSEIYLGSELNIAPIDSPDANGGCSLEIQTSLKVRLSDIPVKEVRIWIAGRDQDVRNSALLRRGW